MLVVPGRALDNASAAESFGDRADTIFCVTLSWRAKTSLSSPS